jgi:hypothetical protein
MRGGMGMKAFIVWVVSVLSFCALPAQAGNIELTGTNPRRDTVVWQDGTIWKNVTVSAFENKKQDKRETPSVEIADVPAGKSSGSFTNWVSIRLRGEPEPPVVPKDVDSVADISRMYSKKSLNGLPAL